MINELPDCTALLRRGIEQGLHIGAQICVAKAGRIVADFATGLARDSHPLREDHRMLWLSAGKPLTAVSILQLQERGRLSIESPVAEYIPEFATHEKSGVLIWHLLTHTHAYHPPAIDWPRISWDEILQQICNAHIPDGREPGEYAAYDPQTSWYLLAEIIQRVSSRRYFEYIDAEILQQIGADSVSFGLPAGEYLQMMNNDQLAPLHDTSQTARDAKNLIDGNAPAWAGENESRAVARNPGGGAIGTARDLCRYYRALDTIWNGEADTGLVRPATLREMTRRVRESLVDHAFKQRVDWGLGFLVNSRRYGGTATPYGYGAYASEDTFGHGGVQSTSAYCDPHNRIAAAVIFNGLPGEAKHNKRASEFNTMLYRELGLAND